MLKIGEKFKLNEAALENYGEEYRDMICTVSHVATSKKDHPGYDESVNEMPLYDAEELNFSVYEWEIEEI